MAPPRGTKRRVSERSDFDPNDGRRPSPHQPSISTSAPRHGSDRPPPSSPTGRARGRGRGGRAPRSSRTLNNVPDPRPHNELSVDGAIDRSEQNQSTATQTPTRPNGASSAPTATDPKKSEQPPNLPRAQAPAERPKTPPPVVYQYLSDESIASWQEFGRQQTLNTLSDVASARSTIQISAIMHELIRSALDDRVDPREAGELVRAMTEHVPESVAIEAQEIFLDTLATIPGVDLSSQQLRTLCFSTQVPAESMRSVLESDILTALGLVQSSFHRMFIRKQTNILYKQSNYNLLREESEGYSKLMTELFSVSQDPEPTSDIAHQTFENIKALIGAFDLDAGRVLDVTLDVCASTLIRNYRFFVKLLRLSDYWPHQSTLDGLSSSKPTINPLPLWAEPDHFDWRLDDRELYQIARVRQERDSRFWPEARSVGVQAFFALGRGRILSNEDRIREVQARSEDLKDDSSKLLMHWISHTGTMPPLGNSVAAQLLGFKLRYYASNIRSEADAMPPSLIYMTAMLIKVGFISLVDIYPHLSPADDAMESVKEKGLKERADQEKAKRGGASQNALTRAAALSDDMAPLPGSRLRNVTDRASTPIDGKSETSKDDARSTSAQSAEVPDQKVSLLKSLLCIGAVPEALYMLGKFPWLLDTVPDLPKHVYRILHHCLSDVYKSALQGQDSSGLGDGAEVPAEDQSGIPRGGLRLSEIPATRVVKWALLDSKDAAESTDYKFYWDEWSDNIPVCQSVDDIFTLCETFLNLVGVKVGQDAVLLTKLARIGVSSLDTDPSPANKDRWQDLLKRLLCPALSFTRSNTAVVDEVFLLLRRYPIKIRYNIYAEWFTGPTSRSSDVKSVFDFTKYETKDILKKINKEDPGPSGRKLAKAAASTPGVVFEVLLNQLGDYDNLIDVVVDCGNHFTDLSYDVLTWSILTFLGNTARGRISQTGFTANKWLVSMSSFTGKILRKYSAMTVQPFIQYILGQLQKNSFIDIRVLRDIIQQMAGVTALADLTDSQMMALAGGHLLRSETLRQLGDERHENTRSARRLISSLIGNQTGGPLLIAIAQQREMSIFNHDEDDNKIMSEVYDEVNTVFRQYLDMMCANTTSEQFDRMIPDVASLIADYGLRVSTAFTIRRSSISSAMIDYDGKHASLRKSSRAPSMEQSQSLDVSTVIEAQASGLSQAKADVKEVFESAIEEDTDAAQPRTSAPTPTGTRPSTPVLASCHPVLQGIADRIGHLASPENSTYISLPFLVTFWQLSLTDLLAPGDRYREEAGKILARKTAIVPDRSDASAASARKREADKKAIDEAHSKLMEENRAKLKHYHMVQNRLTREKDQWLKDPMGNWSSANDALLQECFLPRLVLSPLDSYYAHKMLFFLHSKGTRHFRTMLFFDRLFETQTITNLIYSCSSKEAENLGRFLAEVLKTLNGWHSSRSEYEKKALGHHTNRILLGFASKMNSDGQPESSLDFESYRSLLYKWHRKLSDGLKSCLDQYEYMYVKNAITIMTTIAPHYPMIKPIGQEFLQKLQQVRDREQPTADGQKPKPLARQDLWTSANSAQAPLKRREQSWVMPQDFCILKSKAAAPIAINTKMPAQPKSDAAKQLDAKAQDFTPRATLASNAIPMSAASVEDGEVKDTPMLDAPKMVLPTPDSVPPPRARTPQEPKSDTKPETRLSGATSNSQSEQSKDSSTSTKTQDQSSRSESSSAEQREDERILKQRAMESMRRRVSSDTGHPTAPSDRHVGSAKTQDMPASDTRTSMPSRPPSRSLATEQAPDGPRRDRERSSRHSSYEGRPTHSQAENGYPPHASRTQKDRGPSPRNQPESARPANAPDLSYGRLNSDPDPASSPMARLPPRGPVSATSRDSGGERRFADSSGAMGPPPRRELQNTAVRPPQESGRATNEHRPNGGPSAPPDQATGINPERARMMGESVDRPQDRRSLRHESQHPPQQSRPPIQPSSPRGQRQGTDQGASIRGQASVISPNDRTSFNQTPLPHGPSTPTETTGVHPSRMAQIEGAPRPPPIQTSPQEPLRRPPGGPASGYSSSPASAPSGPRSAGALSAPSPTGYGPPTGPSGGPSGRSEAPRRQFGRIQETLNQSNQGARPPVNGMGPRGGPAGPVVPSGPAVPARGYQNEGLPPPASRSIDHRPPLPPPQFQAGRGVPIVPPPRDREAPIPPRDLPNGPPRSDTTHPPQMIPTAPFDRNGGRGPRREPHSDSRDGREPPHLERPSSRQDRSGPREYREPRPERADLIARDAPTLRNSSRELMPEGPRASRDAVRGGPRELMPEGPAGRDGRSARLSAPDHTRERSPRGETGRETREPRNYSKEYRDRREEQTGPREGPRGPRDDRASYDSRGGRRDERPGASAPSNAPTYFREEKKRDFDGFDEDRRAARGRDGGRPGGRR